MFQFHVTLNKMGNRLFSSSFQRSFRPKAKICHTHSSSRQPINKSKDALLDEQQSNVIQIRWTPAESHSCLAYLIPSRLQAHIYYAWHTLHILGWPHRVMAVHGVGRAADAQDEEVNWFQICCGPKLEQICFPCWGIFLLLVGWGCGTSKCLEKRQLVSWAAAACYEL